MIETSSFKPFFHVFCRALLLAVFLCISGCTASTDSATELLAGNLMVDVTQIQPDTTLGDLTSDPLSVVETIIALEDEFGTSIDDSRLTDLVNNDGWKNVTVSEFLSMARGE